MSESNDDTLARAREIAAGLSSNARARLLPDDDGYPLHSSECADLGLIDCGRLIGGRYRWDYTPLGRAVAAVLAEGTVDRG